MRLLLNEEELKSFIEGDTYSLVYFSNDDSVCSNVKESLEYLNEQCNDLKIAEINVASLDRVREVESEFNIYTLPISIFFKNGKEVFRASKYVTCDEIKANVQKYIK